LEYSGLNIIFGVLQLWVVLGMYLERPLVPDRLNLKWLGLFLLGIDDITGLLKHWVVRLGTSMTMVYRLGRDEVLGLE
jgi:hypothetical protein